ncbi:MAG TPA: hypothetical protein VNC78_04430 [Actinomycetota bacterium]|nr:hypothetical protein [Actinomycetota bacterium]
MRRRPDGGGEQALDIGASGRDIGDFGNRSPRDDRVVGLDNGFLLPTGG